MNTAMLVRAVALLFLFVTLSVVATLQFGQDVLIALGLILTQAKIILKTMAGTELPAIIAWLKTQTQIFFRVELLKKWFMTSMLPMVLGNAALRRIERFLGQYRAALRRQYRALLRWYRALMWYEKTVAALVILFATLALSVSSIGLWLILFSVKLPLWLVAAFAAFGRMIWTSLERTVFRALAFLKLTWMWRFLQLWLPKGLLRRKRRLEYRVARMIVRRRRMTLKQLSEKKDTLPFRLAIVADYLRTPPQHASDDPTEPKT